LAKKNEIEFEKEDVEIQRLFKGFKKQVEELRSKKADLDSTLGDLKRDIQALQQEEFETLKILQKHLEKSTELNQKRAEVEAELKTLEDKLIKLTRISRV